MDIGDYAHGISTLNRLVVGSIPTASTIPFNNLQIPSKTNSKWSQTAIGEICRLRSFAMPVMRPISNLAQLERGAHSSLAIFVRAAYVWLFIPALLGLCASRSDLNGGIWAANRPSIIATIVLPSRVERQVSSRRPIWTVLAPSPVSMKRPLQSRRSGSPES
jgi:hypothetical protein